MQRFVEYLRTGNKANSFNIWGIDTQWWHTIINYLKMSYGAQFKELLQHAVSPNLKIRVEALNILIEYAASPDFSKYIEVIQFAKLLLSIVQFRDASSIKAIIILLIFSQQEEYLPQLLGINVIDKVFQCISDELKTSKFKEDKSVVFLKIGEELDPLRNYSFIDICFMLINNLTRTEKGISLFIKDKHLKVL